MKPTKAEQEILDLILREIRHSAASRDQLMITVDTFVALDGAHVVFSTNPACNTYEVTGSIHARRKRRRPRR